LAPNLGLSSSDGSDYVDTMTAYTSPKSGTEDQGRRRFEGCKIPNIAGTERPLLKPLY
jgi:hypothetical protein